VTFSDPAVDMPAALSTTVSAKSLAALRFVVLKANELQGTGTTSKGLTRQGQADLDYVFPRTAMLAALTHSAAVARQEHDDKVRSRGVYHLFRLPMFWEAQIHVASREVLEQETARAAETVERLFSLLTDLPAMSSDGPPAQGAVDLGELDLGNLQDLARLASTYLGACASNQRVTPFFRLQQ
jgi:hypothetical protein